MAGIKVMLLFDLIGLIGLICIFGKACFNAIREWCGGVDNILYIVLLGIAEIGCMVVFCWALWGLFV